MENAITRQEIAFVIKVMGIVIAQRKYVKIIAIIM